MRKIIVADPDKCSGCRICELACSKFKEGVYNPGKSRIRVTRIIHATPTPKFLITAVACRLCEDPSCVASCPRKALKFEEKTNIVTVDENICDGCAWCVEACEFGALSLDGNKKIVVACDLCDGDPQCVRACPTGALKLMTPEAITQRTRNVAVRLRARLK